MKFRIIGGIILLLLAVVYLLMFSAPTEEVEESYTPSYINQ
jgi:hypothetical protein